MAELPKYRHITGIKDANDDTKLLHSPILILLYCIIYIKYTVYKHVKAYIETG